MAKRPPTSNTVDDKLQIVQQSELVKMVADNLDLYPEDVKRILDCTGETITRLILSADEEHNIRVNWCTGYFYLGTFVPAHYTKNPLDANAEPIYSRPRVKPWGGFSKPFKEKINAQYAEMHKQLNDWYKKYQPHKAKKITETRQIDKNLERFAKEKAEKEAENKGKEE